MHNVLKTIKLPHELARLKNELERHKVLEGPQPQFWRSTCRILSKEYLQRPVWVFNASGPTGEYVFDTIWSAMDIERPYDFRWEVRVKGRIEPLSVGEIADLVGLFDGKRRAFGVPSIVICHKARCWWSTAEVIRLDNPRFRAYPALSGEWDYPREGENHLHNWRGTSPGDERARARFQAVATAIVNDIPPRPVTFSTDDDLNLPPE